jgi:hypothetical protein
LLCFTEIFAPFPDKVDFGPDGEPMDMMETADAGADKHTDWYLLQTIWYVFKKNDRLRQFVQTPAISTCCGQTS